MSLIKMCESQGSKKDRLSSPSRDCCCVMSFFFFQAEDGIRDVAVTGVQTCALPICSSPSSHRRQTHQNNQNRVWRGRNETHDCPAQAACAISRGPRSCRSRRNFPCCRPDTRDRKSTRLNSSHGYISYAVFCLKKKHNAYIAAGH